MVSSGRARPFFPVQLNLPPDDFYMVKAINPRRPEMDWQGKAGSPEEARALASLQPWPTRVIKYIAP